MGFHGVHVFFKGAILTVAMSKKTVDPEVTSRKVKKKMRTLGSLDVHPSQRVNFDIIYVNANLYMTMYMYIYIYG